MNWTDEEKREIIAALKKIASGLFWIGFGIFVIAGFLFRRMT